VISAPFGDDPVLLSQVTVTNHRDVSATVRWVEYWGCQAYQLSFRDFIESAAGMGAMDDLSRNPRPLWPVSLHRPRAANW
jgi:hypothetical protein